MVAAQSPAGDDALHAEKFNEALLHQQRGELGDAKQLYRAILAGDRGHLEALLHLGLICLQEGVVDEAEGLFREAVARDPSSADAHASLANAFLAASRFDEAIVDYRATLDIDPDHAEAHYGLGAALQSLERLDEAIVAYRGALAADPDYAEAAYGLGTALHVLNRDSEAIACYQQALEIDPDYPEANHNLATALQAQGRHEEAIRLFQKAIAVLPGFADAHNNLGVAFTEIGRLDEAREALEKAVALNPKRPGHYQNLFDIKNATAGDPHFLALQALAQDVAAMPVDWQVALHFTMGKTLAHIGEQEQSFRHYLDGNALNRQQVDYDESQVIKRTRISQSFFNAEFMDSWRGLGHPSPLPIFIVGMPRSGSTLIEQILAAHPKVFAAGERLEFRDTLNSFWSAPGPNMTFPERFLATTQQELYDLGDDYLQRLRASTIDGPEAARHAAVDFERITDKLPSNFGVVGVINLILPNARIIHSCRDPIDTCLSCFSTLFSADQPFAWDLGELGRYYRSYVRLMEHWRRVLPKGVMLDVHYEELVADFEPQARRLVAHCGLEWDDACLAFDKAPRPVRTASSAQVRQPIYRSSVGRWRPDEEVLRPLLDGLGPDLAGAPMARVSPAGRTDLRPVS
jgi:tetratricopeptide (TPR) repeat protein